MLALTIIIIMGNSDTTNYNKDNNTTDKNKEPTIDLILTDLPTLPLNSPILHPELDKPFLRVNLFCDIPIQHHQLIC